MSRGCHVTPTSRMAVPVPHPPRAPEGQTKEDAPKETDIASVLQLITTSKKAMEKGWECIYGHYRLWPV